MNISTSNHGRSSLEQIKAYQNGQLEEVSASETAETQRKSSYNLNTIKQDVFEKTTEKESDSSENKITADEEKVKSEAIQTGSLNISFQFDMFYKLSSKVEAKMGQDGLNRFTEISASVSETFMSSFSLSIDGVGSFMNGTDKSLDISPETANEFFDAIEGLSQLEPDALENFLKESDEFFAELEKTYGSANGTFEEINNIMQKQAKQFFAGVDSIREEALPDSDKTELLEGITEATNTELIDSSSLSSGKSEEENSLIKMFFQPEKSMEIGEYKGFLKDFIGYADRLRQQMLGNLWNKQSGYENVLKSITKIENNSAIDTIG